MSVPFPRSPHEKTRGICYFGRMLDKIRLHLKGQLPADYQPNLGKGFDSRCVNFLGVSYEALCDRMAEDGTDEQILDWCHATAGKTPSPEQIDIWNEYMRKRGWNDDGTPMLLKRLAEGGFSQRTDIQTFFDYIDLDEGRDKAR
jgi:hypothetical protein